MKTEIIAVGTEILMGYITNTNSRDISQALLDIGMGTYYQTVVGDNANRIRETLHIASERADIIFLSGGLGPTEDDITKFVLAEFLGEEIMHDARQVERIEAYFAQNNRKVTENNYRQALTITNAQTLFNEVGLATGLIYKNERIGQGPQYYFVLPGPPFEMNHMLTKYIKPYLEAEINTRGVIESEYINLFGIGEAKVANDLDDLISSQENPTIAVYAVPRQVTVRLTANAETREAARVMNRNLAQRIVERLKKHFIGYGADQTLETFIIDNLIQQDKTISVAESLTGGLVTELLTNVPGASKVLKGGAVVYQNETKVKLLDIDQATIEKFTVVSPEVAQEMAEKIMFKTQSDLGLGLTGVAGPGPLEGIQPGTVYIAFAIRGEQTMVKQLTIKNRPRDVVRHIAKNEALYLLKDYLQK